VTSFFHDCQSARGKTGGFTLIETAIIMAVIAVIVTTALSLYGSEVKRERLATTKQRLYDISDAISRYQAKNNSRLPCPAPFTTASGKSNTTMCKMDPSEAGTYRVAGTGFLPGVNDVRIGAVPVVALGLTEDHLTDRWGNRFVYAVSEKLADSTIAYDAANGAIRLYGDGVAYVGASPPDKTPFVVLSAGENHAGAFTYDGKAAGIACPASGTEKDNCDNADATFRAAHFSSSGATATNFDDIVLNTLPVNDSSYACGNLGMIFGPSHPKRIGNGCVPLVIQDPATGNVGIGGPATSGVYLDVQGEMRVGNNAQACTPAAAGSIRYDATTQALQICSGGVWGALSGGQGPQGDQGDKGPKGICLSAP